MKRFFSFWVVSLVFAVIAGLVVGTLEYFTAPSIEKIGSYSTWICADTLLAGCISNPTEIFALYPLVAFFWMVIIYPISRAIIGSFKVVFSKGKNEES